MDNPNKPKRKDIIIAALTSVVITGALAFSYIQGSAAEVSESATPHYAVSTNIESDSQSNSEESVYICTGSHASKYHRHSNCRGLNNCKSEIKSVTRSTAQKQGHSACKICY